MTFSIRPFRDDDASQVVALWEEAGLTRPWNDPHLDIERKMAAQPEGFLVAVSTTADSGVDGHPERVVGTVMAGYDGHRGWLYAVAVHPAHRRKGVGMQLVRHAEHVLTVRGCMKINLQIVSTNASVQAFYESMGYLTEPRISMGKKIESNITG